LVSHLAERNSADTNRWIDDTRFHRVRSEIHNAVQFYQPTGSNGKLLGLTASIAAILAEHGITENLWNDEVWRRSGMKNCLEYNSPASRAAGVSVRSAPQQVVDQVISGINLAN
jgi:hypothetical protein